MKFFTVFTTLFTAAFIAAPAVALGDLDAVRLLSLLFEHINHTHFHRYPTHSALALLPPAAALVIKANSVATSPSTRLAPTGMSSNVMLRLARLATMVFETAA
ncbi:hypothetical protein GYMLUDRAFT_237108 [Collybiopsis luxurians FD-317 M1]|nr:hypothetical protein GYMLUDRAFT_237108 [Collybiopsis luxurians FD-317 M1]